MLQRRGPHLSLYWFSQTVGLNRGLQDAIRAAGLLSDAVQIHVQGGASPDVKEALKSLAVECRVGDRLHFHPQVPPAELLSRAAEHDVGLALETEESLNRRLAVTNKMFLYFIAGLAVAASDLPGQRSVLARCPSAGAMYKPGDFRKLAADLQKWARDPGLLTRTRDASLTAGWNCWNWERESRDLVEAIDGRLRAPSKARRHA
jgi:glycosyltransferase involved in cell wall biosynthesis